MKLDKNKPYGTVCGVSEAFYEQDGVLFDADENSIGDEVPKSRGGRPKKEEAPVDSELEAQLKAVEG